MKNYNITSLGTIVPLEHLPMIRFVIGTTGRYVLSQDISATPMAEFAPQVVARAEVLLPRTMTGFALDGAVGITEAERHASDANEAYTAYLASLETEEAPEPEPEPETRRRPGRPRTRAPEPEPEPEVDEDEVDVDDIDTDPVIPSIFDTHQVIAIDITQYSIAEKQYIGLLDCPAIVDKMNSSERNAQVIRNNYENMVRVANQYGAAVDRLNQMDPTRLPGMGGAAEFALPGVVEDLEPDIRRQHAAGMNVNLQRLRDEVTALETNYGRLSGWFANILENSASTTQYEPLNQESVVVGSIEVRQRDVIKAFFEVEFVEL